MKVKDLIEKLEKLENHNANINILVGNGYEDKHSLWDIVMFSDKTDCGYIELYAHTESEL